MSPDASFALLLSGVAALIGAAVGAWLAWRHLGRPVLPRAVTIRYGADFVAERRYRHPHAEWKHVARGEPS